MLDNPLDFFSVIENGDLVHLSESMIDCLRKQCSDPRSTESSFVYQSTEADAIAVWSVSNGERTQHYARQLFTVLYGNNCEGSITTTYIGNPLDQAPHPYAFALTEFHGTLSSLSFLKQYRFNNLKPVRKFIQFIESNLCTPSVGAEFDFLMHVRPDCYLRNLAPTHIEPPFVFNEPLPY